MISDVLEGPGIDRPIVDVDGNGSDRRQLIETLDHGRTVLRQQGIGRGDHVILVGRDGPEMALAFLVIAAAAACAPLPPTLPTAGLLDAVEALDGRLVIAIEPLPAGAREALAERGIPTASARLFTDDGGHIGRAAGPARVPSDAGPAEPDDVALVLRTSGTTGAPKTVPLTGRGLVGSARTVAEGLALGQDDVGLILMPLFHIHGLVAGLLAPLVAGGGVVCSPGFSSVATNRWVSETGVTWLTAVPTMHQAMAIRHGTHPEELAGHGLRFVRSSSSSMPATLLAEIEANLGVPLIEAYGMTEAAHQMASNPLPPRTRKAGSVGLPAGVEIRIVDEHDETIGPGLDGDVQINGPNMFNGYADPPGADDDAFAGPWFRTGDVGHLDDEGYLHLTGRRKEMINRGGESIAPREVEDALLVNPDVVEALVFGVPDDRLGEQVAALVVARSGAEIDELALRTELTDRLDGAKVPRRILVGDELPTGPTGKPQRVGLAERLGLADLDRGLDTAESDRGPTSEVEQFVAELWADVLQAPVASVHDRWLDVGGDSLLAVRLLGRLNDQLGFDIGVIQFFDRPTVASQADLLEDLLLATGE